MLTAMVYNAEDTKADYKVVALHGTESHNSHVDCREILLRSKIRVRVSC